MCAVLDSGYLSLFEGSHTPSPPFSFWGGPWVQRLEADWCEYYGAAYAVSMNSATSGLYAAIAALGLGYGDEVIVSPYTMSACAACTLLYGAIPIFADVQLTTGCLDPQSIAAHVTDRTKAILVVHQFGIPADMDAILAIARQHNLKVIEDCAQAHGAKYKGRYVGTLGDIGIFSLNVNKTIQTGEGAVCTTNDPDLRYRLALIRNHGEAVVGPAGYENITNLIGFNFRLTEIQAAIAIEQLKKLDHLNQIRLDYVAQLNEALAHYDCLQPLTGSDGQPTNTWDRPDASLATYYVYPLRYLPEVLGLPREQLVAALNAEGMSFYQGYVKPLYLQPLYQQKQAFKHGYPFTAPENQGIQTNYYLGACPNAEILHFEQMVLNEHIRLPHTPGDMNDILIAIEKVMGALESC
ncbi:DegT/DnrJ/EryC1/StrS family aminotransferase [Neosynechococcus sphagnicola]|uniref:DegT/DnrJ/EryC1/StrS family aminotransferase n=1 Tax=Neosynechococcus sphagnicola TaxID=1501145 RepID=UPI001EF9DABF|nr:DegT/DnrJ/EryC1/StrS family aminotransferase [Neosynechococcus sphagnicola]